MGEKNGVDKTPMTTCDKQTEGEIEAITEKICAVINRNRDAMRTTAKKKIEGKLCVDCGDEKPLADFGRNHLTEDGHNNVCRECVDKRRIERNGHMMISYQGRKIEVAPDVVERIVAAAEKNFRPVLYQAAFALNREAV